MARRRSVWVSSSVQLVLVAGTAQHLDLGGTLKAVMGLTSIAGFTVTRMILNLTMHGSEGASCNLVDVAGGVTRVSNAAEIAGVAAMPDPTLSGDFMYLDRRWISEVGVEISATPIYCPLPVYVAADVHSQRKLAEQQTLVYLAKSLVRNVDYAIAARVLWLLP